jgi:hypothetical protein
MAPANTSPPRATIVIATAIQGSAQPTRATVSELGRRGPDGRRPGSRTRGLGGAAGSAGSGSGSGSSPTSGN